MSGRIDRLLVECRSCGETVDAPQPRPCPVCGASLPEAATTRQVPSEAASDVNFVRVWAMIVAVYLLIVGAALAAVILRR